MSKFLIPYKFVPGTKAKAEEVNANFEAITSELDLIVNNSTKKIGDLSTLETDKKDTIVESINTVWDRAISQSRHMGEIVVSSLPLEDAGLHIADGTLFQKDGIYDDFVSYMRDLFYSLSDTEKEKCFTDDETWQSEVNAHGFCRKYVFDETNCSIRLPLINPRLLATDLSEVPVFGNDKVLGLTNGAQSGGLLTWWSNWGPLPFTGLYGDNITPTIEQKGEVINGKLGVLRKSQLTPATYKNTGLIADLTDIVVDTSLYYYIVVGTSVKTSIQVDIDNVATDLNGKADKDFTNVTKTATTLMAHSSMPSDRYEDWTLLASGQSYTPPADGYIVFAVRGTSNNFGIAIENSLKVQSEVVNSGWNPSIYLPCRKGQSTIVSYWGNFTPSMFKFVYAEGAK